METNVIDRCLEHLEPEIPLTATLDEINEKIEKAVHVRNVMYGFEEDAREELQRHIFSLQRQVLSLENGRSAYRKFANLDFFKWRDKQGFPKIVLFSTHSPKFSMEARSSSKHIHFNCWVPPRIEKLYEDVAEMLRAKANQRRWFRDKIVTLKCSYSGVIPEETRQNIQRAKKVFENYHQCLFILAEGVNFSIEEEEVPIPVTGDPLVVGWDGADLWLIDRFDLSSIERLIATEFTL